MNIAVNTRLLLSDKLDGIGWFTYETLKRITTRHPEHKFIFMFDRKYSDEFLFSDNIEPLIVNPQARHPVLWYLYFEFGVPAALKRSKADLFLSPDGWLSLRTNIKSLPVIHDLNFENHPEFIPYHVRKYYLHFFPKYAKKAKRIATVSEYTKKDISQRYEINPEKIDVVYNGANPDYSPVSKDKKLEIQNQYTQGHPYFLFVGTIHPRKNIANLFKAFDKFKSFKSSNLKLLIVGEKKWWTKDIKDAFDGMKYKNEVIFAGRLSSEDLNDVVASATAMTYVSFFEGFGIPIVESFNCEVPVITSNVTSMPEIAGEAALLVDPFSVDSISEAMIKITEDEKLRKALIGRGTERAKMFSWQKSSERLWDSVEKVMSEK